VNTHLSTMTTPRRPECPKARDDVVFRQLDDEWVLFDPRDNKMHVLNLTASLVWTHCSGSLSLPEIAAEVREAFPGSDSADSVERDVAGVVSEFARAGLFQ
jgi:hypothetical protein